MNGGETNPKALARIALRERLRQLAPADRARDSERLRQRLLDQPVWRNARAVMLFVPVPGEPEVWPLVELALRAGKVVALPRHDPAADAYHAAQILDPAADLVPGRFGIREPRPGCPRLNRLDFWLVPGIGFTPDGGRLGRGKGYFDRLLSAVPGLKCGVAFDCQVVSDLPAEPHDICLDCLLTPTRWHWVPGRARF